MNIPSGVVHREVFSKITSEEVKCDVADSYKLMAFGEVGVELEILPIVCMQEWF
jgi:hypothetical protein